MASINGLCTHQQLIDYALQEISARSSAATAVVNDAKSGKVDRLAASGVIAEHRDQACAVADAIGSFLISVGVDEVLVRPLFEARRCIHRSLSFAVQSVRVVGLQVREVTA